MSQRHEKMSGLVAATLLAGFGLLAFICRPSCAHLLRTTIGSFLGGFHSDLTISGFGGLPTDNAMPQPLILSIILPIAAWALHPCPPLHAACTDRRHAVGRSSGRAS